MSDRLDGAVNRQDDATERTPQPCVARPRPARALLERQHLDAVPERRRVRAGHVGNHVLDLPIALVRAERREGAHDVLGPALEDPVHAHVEGGRLVQERPHVRRSDPSHRLGRLASGRSVGPCGESATSKPSSAIRSRRASAAAKSLRARASSRSAARPRTSSGTSGPPEAFTVRLDRLLRDRPQTSRHALEGLERDRGVLHQEAAEDPPGDADELDGRRR